MQRETETGQGSILGADEGLGMGRDENAAEAKITGVRKLFDGTHVVEYADGPPPTIWQAQNAISNAALGLPFKAGHFDNPPINDVLCAADVLLARLDRDAKGQVHREIKYAVLVQVMRSIATEQVGASASVKALALAALEVCCE